MNGHHIIRASRRRGRGGERGQMVPLMAIFAVVLLGCTAIATDLSVSTHYKRNLQNITDAAALEGARQLPAAPTLTDKTTATKNALDVLHNSFPWTGATTQALANAGCSGSQCSVTVCGGLTAGVCTASVTGSLPAFSLTVNTPPKTALYAAFNSSSDPDYNHRVEVIMHERSGGYFAGIFGVGSEVAGAQSVAFHYAPGQPFPFALYSNTVVGDGNSPEVIAGNVYAARYLSPQSGGQGAVCITNDSNGNPGYIVLGSPQGGDAGYQKDGQSQNPKVTSNGDPITENVSQPCTSVQNGTVNMSANPQSTSDCQNAFGSTLAGSNLVYNTVSYTCEANPPLQSPQPSSLPGPPSYAANNPKCSNYVTPPDPTQAPFQCNGSKTPSLLISSSTFAPGTLVAGTYAIMPSGNWPCDVVIDGSYTQLNNITFYLMHDPATGEGAGICAGPPGGVTIQQTPYAGVYDVYSDGSATNPQLDMTGIPGVAAGGSGSGIWQMAGVVWLPTGSVTIDNSYGLQVDGQCLVNSWQDNSGKHLNPSVTYNGQNAPSLPEQLRLVE